MTGPLHSLEELGIAAASLDGAMRIVSANPSFAAILDLTQSSLEGENLLDILRAVASETFEPGAGGTYRIETGADAAWYRLDLKTSGEFPLALLTDVSAERRALEGLRDFYDTRDRLLRDGRIGTWRFDPDAELYYFSNELSLGYEDVGTPVSVQLLQYIQHEDDRDKDTEIRDRLTREGGSARAEMRYRDADGGWTHLHVHYRAGRRTESGRYEMYGISQNITPVARARDEARHLSQRLSFALRAAQAGVFEFDYTAGASWISPELKDLLGSEAVLGLERNPLGPFVPDDRLRVQEFFDDAARGAHANSIDARIAQPEGQRWVRLYFNVTRKDGKGPPLHGVGLLLDIDERKQQEIALADAQRAAEFANRTKTEFLANMSHELRTPLNAILGFSEMTAEAIYGPLHSKYVEYARDIHRSGRHLLELVNDVLDLSKLEAGKLELRESNVEIQALVDESLVLVRGRADAGGIALLTDIAPELPILCADERAMRQLLLNFLSNAVKFTPDGGKVVVTADCGRDGGIWLAVTDSGIGMSAAEIQVALSPFGQVDSKLAHNHEGTGLGLPICRSLIELHGGAMSLTSQPNHGTTLTARFPAERTVLRKQTAVA